jgi:hypothetical protein
MPDLVIEEIWKSQIKDLDELEEFLSLMRTTAEMAMIKEETIIVLLKS